MINLHPLADVHSTTIGKGTTIWQFAVILAQAQIGENCNINCHTFIENDVVLGNNVTVKAGVYLWDGLRVHDNVFIGPNSTFVNDTRPRSKQYPDTFSTTVIEKGASIGANATILGGVTIGTYSMVGAGSVVTKNVPSFSLVVGNPARIVGWINEKGEKISELEANQLQKQLN